MNEQPQEPEILDLLLGPFDDHGITRAIFENQLLEVEHGIPDESVEARRVGRSRARILRVFEPAPDRVEPPCEYFRDWACGGCQWQQISYEGQLARKRDGVDAEMRDAGLPFKVREVHALEDPWRYRSTAGISLGRSAGFRRHGSLAIVPIRDCPISHPLIGDLMATLNDAIGNGDLPDFRGRVRIDVRVAEGAGGELLQTFVRATDPGKLPDPAAVDALLAVLQKLPMVGGVAIQHPDGTIQTVRDPLFAPVSVAGKQVQLTAASFFQTNLRLLPRLIERLQKEATTVPTPRVADVYGGVGVFGLFLAGNAQDVVVVESDALAVQAGQRTAAEWGLSNVRFVEAQAEAMLEQIRGCDIVVVDPPRTGLSAPVLDALREVSPPLLLYVSCLARSLARDLIELGAASYRLDTLELFDFYPQTYHVELLAVLRHQAAAPGME